MGREATGPDDEALRAVGIDPGDRRIALVRRLVEEISRFPRHLSQHVGGFVITRGRLDHLCPISPAAMEGRTVIEWDKDDLDALGLLKWMCWRLACSAVFAGPSPCCGTITTGR